MSDALEIEVKFHVPVVQPVRDRLVAAGAVRMGRLFENNIRFDDESGSLKRDGVLLRLREDDRARLTFKSQPTRPDSQFKVHREVEVAVGDFSLCRSILEGIGFHAVQRYEKWRETFVMGETKLLVDTMPYGVFLEIEGGRSRIRDVADRLGLAWDERILLNYLEIFEIIREKEGLSFEDVTFENFKTADTKVEAYLPLLYAE